MEEKKFLEEMAQKYKQMKLTPNKDNRKPLSWLRMEGKIPERIPELKDLPNLTDISIAHAQATTLDFLTELTTIRKVTILVSTIQDPKSLNNLDHLTELDLTSSSIPSQFYDNLDWLQSKSLKILSMNYEKLKDFPRMDYIPNLEELVIQKSYLIYKIKNINNLKKLKKLELSFGSLETMNGLQGLTNLTHLILGMNFIRKIENIEDLINLELLSLYSNHVISKIENLDHLQKLKRLYIGHNMISKIENLENLVMLQELDLRRNGIEKIEGLSSLKNLRELNLSKNHIKRVENLGPLKSLKVLHLEDNGIRRGDVESIDDLRTLEYLNLKGNPYYLMHELAEKLSFIKELYWD